MSKRMQGILSLVVGLIIIGITLVVYFVGFSSEPKSTIDWVGLVFVLLAEVLFIAGMSLINANIKNSSEVIKVGIISALFFYWVITVILAFISEVLFESNVRAFITIHIILFGLIAILCISLYISATHLKKDDRSVAMQGNLLASSEHIVFTLKNQYQGEHLQKQLGELYEQLKYSDKIVSVAEYDQAIYEQVNHVSKQLNDTEAIQNENVTREEIEEIIRQVRARNQYILKEKRGGV